VLSQQEVLQFLGAIPLRKHRMAMTTAYAAGLRVSEVAVLRVEDIDSARMLIHVHQGKGKKDRIVPLSEALLRLLRAYWRVCRPKVWLFPGMRPDKPICKRALPSDRIVFTISS
jgi:integrase/recombinase XerD